MNCCNATCTDSPLQSFKMSFRISKSHSIVFIAHGKASNLQLKFYSFPTLNYVTSFGGLQYTSNPGLPLWIWFGIPCFVAQSKNVKLMCVFQAAPLTLTLSQDLPYSFQGHLGAPVFPMTTYIRTSFLSVSICVCTSLEIWRQPIYKWYSISGVGVRSLSCPLLPTSWLEPITIWLHWRSTCISTLVL